MNIRGTVVRFSLEIKFSPLFTASAQPHFQNVPGIKSSGREAYDSIYC
jgi:hypothetical protein